MSNIPNLLMRVVKKAAKSILGTVWTARTAASEHNFYGSTYGNGLFMIVGDIPGQGSVQVSSDGINWTNRYVNTPTANRACAYGKGSSTGTATWVVVGDAYRGSSTDTISWSNGTTTQNWKDICFSPDLGRFVSVGFGGTGTQTAYSNDGTSWVNVSSSNNNQWNSVCWGKGPGIPAGLFVAMANTSSGNRTMISANGGSWTGIDTPSQQWNGIAYGVSNKIPNGLFVACNGGVNQPAFLISENGVDWTEVTATGNNWYDITFADGRFIAIGPSRSSWSDDGVNWNYVATPQCSSNTITYSPISKNCVAAGGSETGTQYPTRIITSP